MDTAHHDFASVPCAVTPRRALRWLALLILGTSAFLARADGYWSITQLPIRDGIAPAINNSGEVVWCLNPGGIYSSTRGRLATSGWFPHLANSGEVVYMDYYNQNVGLYDLVSTTRGRLTFGGLVDPNTAFDVNSSGEIVYTKNDAQGNSQIFSTLRGQITFQPAYHYSPCINELGEIVWGQSIPGGGRTFSTTRGMLPENYGGDPCDLNNLGEICFTGSLQAPDHTWNSPIIFSSAHGVLINNPNLNQWGGSLNDAGVVIWEAPELSGTGHWSVYQGVWVVPEPSTLALFFLGGFVLLRRFPPNSAFRF